MYLNMSKIPTFSHFLTRFPVEHVASPYVGLFFSWDGDPSRVCCTSPLLQRYTPEQCPPRFQSLHELYTGSWPEQPLKIGMHCPMAGCPNLIQLNECKRYQVCMVSNRPSAPSGSRASHCMAGPCASRQKGWCQRKKKKKAELSFSLFNSRSTTNCQNCFVRYLFEGPACLHPERCHVSVLCSTFQCPTESQERQQKHLVQNNAGLQRGIFLPCLPVRLPAN